MSILSEKAFITFPFFFDFRYNLSIFSLYPTRISDKSICLLLFSFVIHSNKNDGYELSVAPSFGSSGIGRLVNRFYNVLTLNGKESLDKYSKTIISIGCI